MRFHQGISNLHKMSSSAGVDAFPPGMARDAVLNAW